MTSSDIKIDLLVIGGGIAGVVAAISSKKIGQSISLMQKAGSGSGFSSGAINIANDYGFLRPDNLEYDLQ